jgi:hypothetical protein
MGEKGIEIFGEHQLHDLWRSGVSAVATEDGHETGGHFGLNLQATDITGTSFGVGVSSYLGPNSKLVGGSANFVAPVFFAVWGGGEVEVLRNLEADKTTVGAAAGLYGILPFGGVPIYLKGGLMDVTDFGSWTVTGGVSFSFELLRSQ